MNLLILGPQGCGKGTQAELLARDLNLHHFEMGRVLRSIAKSKNKFAPVVAETLRTGNLVPDDYVRLIAWDFINKHKDKHEGIIFEGYPRGVAQYMHLKEMLARKGKKLAGVFFIDISEKESIKRLSSRRTCIKCGEVFNLDSKPPLQEGICDVCGGELIVREDDTPSGVKRRLQLYKLQTKPVFDAAVSDGIGMIIDGERPIEIIHEEMLEKCQKIV